MRILHIITKSELGGAQSVLSNIVNTLCPEHEVAVIAGEGDGKMFDAIDNRIKKIRYPHLKRAISIYHDVKTLLFLWKFNREYKPDVIHLHSSKAGLLGRLILPKQKIVYTVHGFDSIRVAYRKLLPIERMIQRRCKAIVGVSQYDVNNLHSEGISANTHLVYNGVDKHDIVPAPFPIPATYSKVVLCIARVAKPKRHDIFIECAKKLPQYAFVWIGNLGEISNHPDNVFFMGNISNASIYCQQSDLFMLASDYEGLPIVLLEAMSYGKPLVASKVGGIPEIVIDEKNGYTLPNNASMFAEKIDYILKNENIQKQFSEYSYQLFTKHFTIEKMVDGYMNIYRSI
jgi:glycosyltransferase involved in cell wall biosynthesis